MIRISKAINIVLIFMLVSVFIHIETGYALIGIVAVLFGYTLLKR